MTRRLTALVVLMFAGDVHAQNVSSRIAAGESVEICGVVTSVSAGLPNHCDATLEIKTSATTYKVVIPASVRRETPGATRPLLGATACFTGVVQLESAAMTLRAPSFDAIRLTKPAERSTIFGSGAIDSCETSAPAPRILSEKHPRYTSEAMRAGVQGAVGMDAVVDATGVVSDVQVTRPLDPGLDEQAVKALRTWKFAPATLEGKPIAVIVSVEMTFSLRSRR